MRGSVKRLFLGPAPVQRIDAIILGALLLAAAGSALGVLTYDDTRLATFDVTWGKIEEQVEFGASGVSASSATGDVGIVDGFEVTRSNLTSAFILVRVGSNTPLLQPTSVLVEVIDPSNNTTSAEGEIPVGAPTTVEIPIEVLVATLPSGTSIRASSLEAARGALGASSASSSGVGEWIVQARFSQGPVGTGSYTMAGVATLTYYEAEITPQTPEAGR